MKPYTDEALRQMPVHDRHQLWKNARSKSSSDAKELVARIESLGLPFSDAKSLKYDDPLTLKIIEIVYSGPAKIAAVEATDSGLPALAGIEPFLIQALGIDYNPDNAATNRAGSITAEMMTTRGYRKTGKKRPMPDGSVAKTAEFFQPAKV